MSERAFRVASIGAVALAVTFLALPLVALALRVPPGRLLEALTDDAALQALGVSLRTSLVAHLLLLVVGTPAAYLLATRRFRGRSLLIGIVELPLVLPPAVAGIGLLAAFGRAGLLGDELRLLGISIPFTEAAVVMAVAYVASPFYIRQAIAAFEAVPGPMYDAARTLGSSPHRTFLSVAIPLASGGLATGSAVAWARGLGEFGATIMFAGSIQGVTQTLPLAIYAQLDSDLDVALAIGVALVIFSAALLLAVRTVPSWQRLTSTSR